MWTNVFLSLGQTPRGTTAGSHGTGASGSAPPAPHSSGESPGAPRPRGAWRRQRPDGGVVGSRSNLQFPGDTGRGASLLVPTCLLRASFCEVPATAGVPNSQAGVPWPVRSRAAQQEGNGGERAKLHLCLQLLPALASPQLRLGPSGTRCSREHRLRCQRGWGCCFRSWARFPVSLSAFSVWSSKSPSYVWGISPSSDVSFQMSRLWLLNLLAPSFTEQCFSL